MNRKKLIVFSCLIIALYFFITNYAVINLDNKIIIEAGQSKNIGYKDGIYQSLNEGIATIDELGNIYGLRQGKTNILINYNGKKYVKRIVINDPKQDILLNESYIEINADDKYTLKPILKKNVHIISYINNAPNVIKIDNGKIEALKPGVATVTIRTNTAKEAKVKIRVKETPLDSIFMDNLKYKLVKGTTKKIYIYTSPSYFEKENIVWKSSDEKVATVDNGRVSAVGNGTAVISASIANKTVECLVIVKENLEQNINISLDKINLNLNPNETYDLKVISNNNIDLSRIKWSTTDKNIAIVNNGRVYALNPGKAMITAQLDDQSYSTIVNVSLNQSVNYLKEKLKNSSYTNEEILEYFKEVALKIEYGNQNNSVKKWNTPIYYYLDENAKEEDQKHIQLLIEKLNEIPTLPLFIKSSLEEANLVIHFTSSDTLYKIRKLPGIEGYCHFEYDKNNILRKSEITISSDLELETRKSVITEEIVQALGLTNDSEKYENSIFYQYASNLIYPSDLDFIIISLLYNENIKYGMNYENVEEVLNQIK